MAKQKTAAQLAKKARNEEAARARLDRLQADQRLQNDQRAEWPARRLAAAGRAAELLVKAQAVPQFATWLRINRYEATPGRAALFFSRHPQFRPAEPVVLPPMPRAGEVRQRCPIKEDCDCLAA